MKRFLSTVLVAGLICSIAVFAQDKPAQMEDDCVAYILAGGALEAGDEWAVLALARSGVNVPEDLFSGYLDSLRALLEQNGGRLSSTKYTEYARTALVVAALGGDPRNIAGYDILAPLEDYSAVTKQGINGPVWALLALDSAGVPTNGQGLEIRNRYIDYILERELAGGGFAMTGDTCDIDITAMAALALARYPGAAGEAAVRAGEVLAGARRNGYYLSLGTPTCESAAQAVIAMCGLGMQREEIEPALEALARFHIPREGFAHQPDGGVDKTATVQTLLALVAFDGYERGAGFIYDMRSAVNKAPKPVFSDFPKDCEGAQAVYALAQRGIITGFENGEFRPQGAVTRAQLAAIFVRALGLEPGGGAVFSDVLESSWFAPYAMAAAEHGIIECRGQGIFDPDALVTRQDASLMLERAMLLCGVESIDDSAVDVIDYSSPLSRLEAAQMVYTMLCAANLIEP